MFIMEELTTLGHTYNLTAYEKVGSVYLHPDLFTVDNGLMTQAGLLKRRTLETYFKPQIDIMYSKLPWLSRIKQYFSKYSIIYYNDNNE